jgi:hypothetical protein
MGIYGDQGLTLMETMLLVDAHFVEACVITGNAHQAKYMFGELEWVNWLHARRLAKDLGRIYLNENSILALHYSLLWYSPSRDNAGKFSNKPAGRGGIFLGGEFRPVHLTSKQIEAVSSTPYTTYVPDEPSNDPHLGYIQYLLGDSGSRRDAVYKACRSYNRLILHCRTDADRLDLAARVYRELIAAHAMAGGECGRHARLILYAMCESHRIAPPHLDNFDNDLLLHEDEWVEEVKAGSALHTERRRKLCMQPDLSAAELLGLQKEQELYTHTPRMRFTIGQPGELHDHQRYKDFVIAMKQAVGSLAIGANALPAG